MNPEVYRDDAAVLLMFKWTWRRRKIRQRSSADVILSVLSVSDDSVEELKRGLFKLRERLGVNGKAVIVGVPHRYDRTRYRSKELLSKKELADRDTLIADKNVLLKDFCKYHKYTFLNIDDSERCYFTQHGLHFNMTGKRWLARKIETAVYFL